MMIWLCLLTRWLSNWLINRELNSRRWQHKWNGWNDELSPGLLLCGGPRIIQNHLEAKQQQLHKNAKFGLKSMDLSFNVIKQSRLINSNKRGKHSEIKENCSQCNKKETTPWNDFNGPFRWNLSNYNWPSAVLQLSFIILKDVLSLSIGIPHGLKQRFWFLYAQGAATPSERMSNILQVS